MKVITVEGLKHIPVKRWEVSPINSEKKSGKFSLLKVYLEYGLEDSYEFTVISELEFVGTSTNIKLPGSNGMVNKITRHINFL